MFSVSIRQKNETKQPSGRVPFSFCISNVHGFRKISRLFDFSLSFVLVRSIAIKCCFQLDFLTHILFIICRIIVAVLCASCYRRLIGSMCYFQHVFHKYDMHIGCHCKRANKQHSTNEKKRTFHKTTWRGETDGFSFLAMRLFLVF